MNKEFTEDNLEKIEKYLRHQMTKDEKESFEKDMIKDSELKELVDQYQLMQEGFELKELDKRRQQLQIIKELADDPDLDEVMPVEDKETRSRVIDLKLILSYAAMIALGLAAGWFIFQQTPATEQPGGGLISAGPTEGAIVLYDADVQLINLQQEDGQLKSDTTILPLIITKVTNPEKPYDLQEDFLELFFSPAELPSDNLGASEIQLIIQQFRQPVFQLVLLNIDRQFYQIPFTDEDFSKILD